MKNKRLRQPVAAAGLCAALLLGCTATQTPTAQPPPPRPQAEDRSCFGADRLRGQAPSGATAVDNAVIGSDLLSPFGEGRICGPFRSGSLGTAATHRRETYDGQGRVLTIRDCGGETASPSRREALRDAQGRLTEIREFECPETGRMMRRLAVERTGPQSAAVYAFDGDGRVDRGRGPLRTVSFANGQVVTIVSGSPAAAGWSSRVTLRDGRVVSVTNDRGQELVADRPTPDQLVVTRSMPHTQPRMESYTVAERDRFGNAGRVIPAEIRREFGIASTQSFSVRFNTYSPN